MRKVRDLDDVQIVLDQIQNTLDRINSKNIDLSGRRIINAGNAVDNRDYITKEEKESLINTIMNKLNDLDISMYKKFAEIDARLKGHGL